MESKYKKRAELVLNDYLEKWKNHLEASVDENIFYDDWIIDAMCQLAEEIYNEFITLHTLSRLFYSKEQVEELLQKQRELCAEESSTVLVDYGFGEFREVDKDSILNAKLKID